MYSIIFMIDVIGTIDFSNAQTIKVYEKYPSSTKDSERQIDVLCSADGQYIKYNNKIYEILDEDGNFLNDYNMDNPLRLNTAARLINGYYDIIDENNNAVTKFFKNGIQCNQSHIEQNLDTINEEDENLNKSF